MLIWNEPNVCTIFHIRWRNSLDFLTSSSFGHTYRREEAKWTSVEAGRRSPLSAQTRAHVSDHTVTALVLYFINKSNLTHIKSIHRMTGAWRSPASDQHTRREASPGETCSRSRTVDGGMRIKKTRTMYNARTLDGVNSEAACSVCYGEWINHCAHKKGGLIQQKTYGTYVLR